MSEIIELKNRIAALEEENARLRALLTDSGIPVERSLVVMNQGTFILPEKVTYDHARLFYYK